MKTPKKPRTKFAWTPELEEFVVQHWTHMRDQDIAAELSKLCGVVVTAVAVRWFRNKHGLAKQHGKPQKYF